MRVCAGTTKKGIGPAYASKINRVGLRFGDLRFWNDFEERFRVRTSYIHAHKAYACVDRSPGRVPWMISHPTATPHPPIPDDDDDAGGDRRW